MADDSFDEALATLEIPSEPKRSKVITSQTITNQPSTSRSTNNNQQQPAQTTNVSTISPKKPPTSTPATAHHILVHPRQRGNPLLKAITNVPWQFEDIIPDYIVGPTRCILFLSLKYHTLNPDYIHTRLKLLGKRFELRVLLVQVDTKESHNALKHLTRMCFLADLTLMLAWSAEEAGKMIETYKLFENRPPDLIQERAEQYPHQKLVTALTNIKPINKTDAVNLIQNFGTLENLINTTEGKLEMCAGLGPRKAKKLHKTFNEPFLRNS